MSILGGNFTTRSLDETWELAARLVDSLANSRAVLALHGDLGSGKTSFTQGVARALGIARPVTSPTFTIINEYPGDCPLYHIDLYRLKGPDDVLALGFEDYLAAEGITAVEWPERAGDLLPPSTIHIRLVNGDEPDTRYVEILPGQAALA